MTPRRRRFAPPVAMRCPPSRRSGGRPGAPARLRDAPGRAACCYRSGCRAAAPPLAALGRDLTRHDPMTQTEVTNMALFCDFENIALGVRDAKYEKFDIGKVLERLLLKGSIVVKKAYCDWDRYKEFKAPMHEASFELIEIPHVRQSGKNSADIRMVVDALDLCYTKAHVDTFVIISGDSDFSPLVSQAARERQDGDRRRRQELDLRSADRQLRRVHLLRRPRAREEEARRAQGAGEDRGAAAKAAAKAAAPTPRRRRRRRRASGGRRRST